MSGPPKHIVAVAAFVTDPQDRVLVLLGPRGDWEFPGGQVELGENLIDALRREVLEETGIEVNVGKLAGVYSNVLSHIVMFDFICEAVGGTLRNSDESLAVEWVPKTDVLNRIARPPIRDRMRHMMEFDGTLLYRAYEYPANDAETEYSVTHETRI